MKLYIFHYHLLTGGVVNVIMNLVRALARDPRGITEIVLICGRVDNGEELIQNIAPPDKTAGPDTPQVMLRVHPNLYYQDKQTTPLSKIEERRQLLMRLLIDDYLEPEAVWWIHNYHLGKNPAFTAALLEVIQANPQQRVLLQIHDFPECARYQNLMKLRAITGDAIYPQHSRLAYLVINAHDRTVLRQAGIDHKRIFLLPNIIEPAAPTDTINYNPVAASRSEHARQTVRHRLLEAFGNHDTTFSATSPLALYPVRSIRRKNVLEAGLLCRMVAAPTTTASASSADNPALVVTLPGTSTDECGYSALVASTFTEGLIPGLFGIGSRLPEVDLNYQMLLNSADLFLSSSVQEGFGFTFFEAIMSGRPLVARWLNILRGYDNLLRPFSPHFYHRLEVPFARLPDSVNRELLDREAIHDSYCQRLALVEQYISDASRSRLQNKITALLSKSTIDFSFLAPLSQVEVLRAMSDARYHSAVQQINRSLLIAWDRIIGTTDRSIALRAYKKFYATFSGTATCQRLATILKTISIASPSPCVNNSSTLLHLIDAFAHIDNLRLLYQ